MSEPAHPPLRVGTVWIFDLQQPVVEVSPLLPVTFRRIDLHSTRLLTRSLGAAAIEEFNQRLSSGRRCYTAWVGSQLAGYGWVSFGGEDVGELGIHLQLQPCEAYVWDCYTLPAFRGKRVYPALLAWILHVLSSEGLCWTWIGADRDNLPSQQGIDRAGFMRVADLLIGQEIDQRSMWLEGYPGVPESLVSEARRVYLGSLEILRMQKS